MPGYPTATAPLPNSRQMMGVSLPAYLESDLSEIAYGHNKSRQTTRNSHQDRLAGGSEWSQIKRQQQHRSLFRKRIKSVSMPVAVIDAQKTASDNEMNAKKNPWSRSLIALVRKLRSKPDGLRQSPSAPGEDRQPCTIDNASAHILSLYPLTDTSLPSSSFETRAAPNKETQEHQTILHANNSSVMSKRTDHSSSDFTMHSIFNTYFCCDDDEDEGISSLDAGPLDSKNSAQENEGNSTTTTQITTTAVATAAWTYENCLSPPIENQDTCNERSRSDTAAALSRSAKDMARALWNHIGSGNGPLSSSSLSSICGQEGMAEWLGKNDPFRASVLNHYMDHFDFSNQRLDDAFRMLCSKFYFKAETQQIDRILQTFALRYWECNPMHVLRSSDIVYAIAYSMLLLNTDLHVAQEKSRHRMTRSKFIRNTMATIYDLAFPSHEGSSNMYVQASMARSSVPTSESIMSVTSVVTSTTAAAVVQPTSPKWMMLRRSMSLAGPNDMRYHRPIRFSNGSSSTSTSTSTSSTSTSNAHVKEADRQWLSQVEALLKDIYNAVKMTKISQIDDGEEAMDDEQQKRRRNRRGRSFLYAKFSAAGGGGGGEQDGGRHRDNEDDSDLLASPTQPPTPLPMIEASPRATREGVVMKKQVMEAVDKKARQRGWQLCYLSAHNGTLSIHRPAGLSGNSGEVGMPDRRRRSLSILLPGQNHENRLALGLNLTSNTLHQPHHLLPGQILHKIDLKHALATALPSPTAADGVHHVFCLQTAEGGVWLFEAADLASVLEWVAVCNYWGARLSKEPLAGGAVSNLDYGWGGSFSCPDPSRPVVSDGPAAPLPEWNPPLPSLVPSALSEKDQLRALERRALDIDKDLDLHREARQRIHQRFAKSPAQIQRALDNWERRAQYMIQELIKTRTYCDILAQFIVSP